MSRIYSRLMLLAAVILVSLSANAQNTGSHPPIVVVTGESSLTTDADVITCTLDIYDYSFLEDYSGASYMDETVLRNQQLKIIDKIEVKNYMTSPTYDYFKNNNVLGPFELKFTSKEQYDKVMKAISDYKDSSLSISLAVYKTEISDTKRKQIYNQCLQQAVTEAAIKAQSLATGMKGSLGSPVRIEEILQSADPYSSSYLYDYSFGDNAMKVNVKAQVRIEYTLQ
jgi:uncharacterized protein YggE